MVETAKFDHVLGAGFGGAVLFQSGEEVIEGLGNGVYSMIVSIARQLIVLLPVAYLFAHTIGVNAVWWAFPIAEVVAFVVCLIMYRFVDRKYFKNLEKGQVLENLEGMEPVEPAV